MVKYFSESMKIEPGMVAHSYILRIPSVEAGVGRSQVQGQPGHTMKTVKCCVMNNDKCTKSSFFSTLSVPIATK